MSKIKNQMLTAQLLLAVLERESSFHKVLVRGGAPRNWFMNREANDIDIFIEVQKGFASREYWEMKLRMILGSYYTRFTFEGDNVHRVVRLEKSAYTDPEIYSGDPYSGGNSDIISVLEGNFEGKQKIQFVIVDTSVDSYYRDVTDAFPTGLSKISFNSNGELNASLEFMDCIRNEAIIYDPCLMTDRYKERLMSYFPHYAVVSKWSKLGRTCQAL